MSLEPLILDALGRIDNPAIVAIAVVVAGLLIGATGVGGILLVPVLVTAGHVPVEQAIAAASASFAIPALATLGPLKRDPGAARRHVPLLLSALLAASAGAFVVAFVNPRLLLALLAVLVLVAGVRGLVSKPTQHAEQRRLSLGTLIAVGAFVGLGSALTGTGGPVLLLPILLLLHQETRASIVAAQASQLPIAIAAGLVHAFAGRLNIPLALACGVLLMLSAWSGHAISRRIELGFLHRGVSMLLIVVAAWFAWITLRP